ncbi:fasciclin domain-containing protein, partial [Methanoculleus sp.]|uniref:fasciclin domain-containing protein n=1 Tax=Methanoculleus sp. TaxID=90427 RepID=UPI002FCA3762
MLGTLDVVSTLGAFEYQVADDLPPEEGNLSILSIAGIENEIVNGTPNNWTFWLNDVEGTTGPAVTNVTNGDNLTFSYGPPDHTLEDALYTLVVNVTITGNVTPTPTGNVTPTPTGNVTPTPTGNVTPTPTGNVTPTPTGNVTPTPTGNVTPTPTGNVTPMPTGNVTPPTEANVTIVEPMDGATLPAGNVTVSVNVTNFTLVEPAGQPNAPGEGHLHYYLDAVVPTNESEPAIPATGGYVISTNLTHTWENVTAGEHNLSVQAVNNDHTPLIPLVFQTVNVTVGGENVTPMPTGNVTPTPTGNVTPTPTGNVTPTPTGNVTPTPTENVTPTPTGNVTPMPTENVTPMPTGNVTPMPTGNVTPMPTGNVTPPTEANVTIVEPMDGATLPAGNVTVSVNVTNFTLVEPAGQPNAPGEGHLHYYLDAVVPTNESEPAVPEFGGYVISTNLTHTWENVTAGEHNLSVQLVNNDHTPLIPLVFQTVNVTVGGENVTPIPTENVTPTPTENVTPTPTGNVTPTPTENVTPMPTENVTPMPTENVTPMPTGNVTPTPTGNVTPTPTMNVTPMPTMNVTPTPTVTPPGGAITREIVEGLSEEENLTIFVGALNNSTIGETLDENASYVICAPTNDAFAGIDNQTLSVILNDTTLLNTIIGYHIIQGDYTIEELLMLCQNSTDGQISLPTVEGRDVNVSFVNGQLTINNFIVITQIQITNNIVVYVIDGVLIPPGSGIPTPTPTMNVTPTPTMNVTPTPTMNVT